MQYSVLNYIESSALSVPDKIAVSDENNSCTYKELVCFSKKAGTSLSNLITPCMPVAVFMEKSINTLYAFWGSVYAGGFYVLFNPELPGSRLVSMQKVLRSEVIVTDEKMFPLAKELFSNCNIVLIEDLIKTEINEAKLNNIRSASADADPLYANFTSGSTGTPKAVVVGHRSVIDFIDNFTETFGIDSSDTIGNQAPFDFDVSVKDIYSAAKTGAELVLIPKHFFSEPQKLQDYICDKKMTTLIWAVSALCLISTFHGLDYRIPDTLKRVLFSGEVMPMKHLKAWMEHLPGVQFVNLYGPTEITCNCTYHIIERDCDYKNGIPIGVPFRNEHVFLLDSENREIRGTDEIGEICVGGSALALGYYNDSAQSGKSFCQNPCQPFYFDRIYRTGDLGKRDESGNLFFCGRKDFQIKHMGHRIELEEIDKFVGECSGIERCCCLFDNEKDKLYCFYVGNAEKSELYAMLKKKLPVFMVPGAYRKIDEMPITKNGKIDRKELMARVRGKKNDR